MERWFAGDRLLATIAQRRVGKLVVFALRQWCGYLTSFAISEAASSTSAAAAAAVVYTAMPMSMLVS